MLSCHVVLDNTHTHRHDKGTPVKIKHPFVQQGNSKRGPFFFVAIYKQATHKNSNNKAHRLHITKRGETGECGDIGPISGELLYEFECAWLFMSK